MSSSTQVLPLPLSTSILENRWTQLALSLICMMAISSPQYVWALLTKPMVAAFGVNLSQLQVTFSILIVFQTFLSPFQGYLIDRFGPRTLLSIGGALTGLSWILASQAPATPLLFLSSGLLGGFGPGLLSGAPVGQGGECFPE